MNFPLRLSPAAASLAIVLGFFPHTGLAHKVSAVSVVADFNTKTGAFKVELAMDVDPTGDPTIDDQIPPEQAARTFATESLEIYFDDQAVKLEPEIKVLTASDEDTPAELVRKKVVGTLSGQTPEGAENFLLRVTETTEAAVVMVTVKDGKPARRLQVLYPGEFSNPVSLEPVLEGDPFTAEGSQPAKPDAKTVPGEATSETETDSDDPRGFGSWLAKGFLAVLPMGIDFWLFIAAMILLSLRSRPLGWQIGLYTVAHSLTLALATFKLVALPPEIVLPVVAISAVYPAVENLFTTELKPWRGAIIFVLGLFHGLAFADLLWATEPRLSQLVPALVGFNLGIELAQLALLVVASLIAVALVKRPWFRHAIVVPLCVIVAGIALFRFIDVVWLS
jgi:hypothetical protein